MRPTSSTVPFWASFGAWYACSSLAPPAASGELVEVALDATAGDAGQPGNVLVRASLALEPQDFHLLLHAGMRIVIAVVADGGEGFRREAEVAHGILQCS